MTALFVGGLQLYIQTEADAAAAQLRVGKTIRAVTMFREYFITFGPSEKAHP